MILRISIKHISRTHLITDGGKKIELKCMIHYFPFLRLFLHIYSITNLQALTEMLDSITSRVLDEAKKVNDGTGPSSATAAGVASSHNNQALTSLDIHKAIKRLLPGEPGDPLRPYLPTVTKHAWHLDKQSLKGIKKQKVTANQQQQENLLLQEATAELVDQLVENEAPSTATANV